jgi:Reverse transcriptase (RNA-dependent DNA polymerase)
MSCVDHGNQKIPYHIVFDVKYDLRHKARLVAGGNWTVNDKKDIYSGVVRMDTVRIRFFLGELYGLSCCACDIGNAFLYGKTKEKVYITAVQNLVQHYGERI